MEKQKRRPIRKRILMIVLTISAISLFATSLFGIISMMAIQSEARNALTTLAKDNLQYVIQKKTALADQRLNNYADMAAEFTYYVEELLAHPERYKPRDLTSPDTYTTGDLVYSFALADESYDWNALMGQAEVFANVAERFYPVVAQNKGVVKATYFGFDNGLLLSYDTESESVPPQLMYYDFLSTDWYAQGKAATDGVEFTAPYTDSFGRGLTITCVNPVHDKNGAVVGVLGVDMGITDLYDNILDLDLGDDVSAFVMDANGKVISLENTDDEAQASASGPELQSSDKKRMESFADGIVVRDNCYYAFNTIESVGWRLCVRVPQSSVLELADSIREKIVSSIIIFVIFFLIVLSTVVILVAEISENITKPIIDLMRDVDEIIGGDLDHRAEKHMNDEIGDLAGKFNEMSDSLKEQIKTLTKVTAEKERIGTELVVAAKLQADMLPKTFPERDDLRLYATMTPAKEMGGDFYDFFMIDKDHLGLVMADVSGKGVPAAMLMIVAKTLIKVRATRYGTPSQMLTDVNKTICADNPGGLFVTVWLGILTLSTGKLISSNAGHEYPAIRRKGGEYDLIVSDHLPPLATIENVVYADDILVLNEGDELFLYTDGVPEAKAPDGSRFGTAKMLDILNRDKDLQPDKVLAGLKDEIDKFSGENELFDDVTMMCVVRGKLTD